MDKEEHIRRSITLYTRPDSRSGQGIVILLNELGLHYHLHRVHHAEEISDDAFTFSDFHDQLPILTDMHDDGQRFRLQEFGVIVQYLTTRYDTDHRLSYPKGSPEDLEWSNWLFFLASRLGPSHEEAVHFSLQAPESIPYVISRFTDQTLQLYMALEKHLQVMKQVYLVDGKLSAVDLVYVPYIARAKDAGIDIKQFPKLERWYSRIAKLPTVAVCLEMAREVRV